MGSLPFRRFDAALRFVRSTTQSAPYLPELPRLPGAAMLDAIDAPRDPVAIERFLAQLPGSTRLIKLQLCGPLTYALARDQRIDRAAERIGRHLDALLSAVSAVRIPKLLVIDEPGLTGTPRRRAALATPQLRNLFARIRAHSRPGSPTFAGLHCCGAFELGLLGEADPDVFSFDAWNALEAVLSASAFQSWFRRRRALALGIVPTRSPSKRVDSADLARRSLDRMRHAFASAGRIPSEIPAPLLTGNCGFGSSSLAWTKRAHATLTTIERLLKRNPLGT